MPVYRALNGLTIPVDRQEVDRILKAREDFEAGLRETPLPYEDRQLVTYEPGDVIDYVPEESLEWLLEQGQIEEVKDD